MQSSARKEPKKIESKNEPHQFDRVTRHGYKKVRQELDKLKDPYRSFSTGDNGGKLTAGVALLFLSIMIGMALSSLDKRLRGCDGKLGGRDVPSIHGVFPYIPFFFTLAWFFVTYKTWRPFKLEDYPTINHFVREKIIPSKHANDMPALMKFLDENLEPEFAFLSGTHRRLGAGSPVLEFSQDRHYDCRSLRIILGFLRHDEQLKQVEERQQDSEREGSRLERKI